MRLLLNCLDYNLILFIIIIIIIIIIHHHHPSSSSSSSLSSSCWCWCFNANQSFFLMQIRKISMTSKEVLWVSDKKDSSWNVYELFLEKIFPLHHITPKTPVLSVVNHWICSQKYLDQTLVKLSVSSTDYSRTRCLWREAVKSWFDV